MQPKRCDSSSTLSFSITKNFAQVLRQEPDRFVAVLTERENEESYFWVIRILGNVYTRDGKPCVDVNEEILRSTDGVRFKSAEEAFNDARSAALKRGREVQWRIDFTPDGDGGSSG